MSTRHGRLCKIPQINLRVTGTIRTMWEGSFQIRGPQLFNSIPANIRGLTRCTVNTFKHKLDEYLKNIPDTPKIPGYTIQTDTNSITSMRGSRESWAIHLRRSHRLGQRDYSRTLNLNLRLPNRDMTTKTVISSVNRLMHQLTAEVRYFHLRSIGW